MANPDQKGKKQKRFLEQPKYPGGGTAYKKFISENLKYPKAAFEKGVEGSVYVKFVVDNQGNVIDARVTKGLGYGCDEEAIRLVKLLKYNKAKNRGVRVSSKVRTRIIFKIRKKKAAVQVQYETTYVEKKVSKKIEKGKPERKVYTYTVTIP